MKLHPEAPQLWRAMVKAFFPVQLPMYFPFVIVTTAKIVQAHVGVKGLIHVLDSGGAASEVRREGGKEDGEKAAAHVSSLYSIFILNNRATSMRA